MHHSEPPPPLQKPRSPGKSLRLAWIALALGICLVVAFGWRAWKKLEYTQRVESGEVAVETLRGWMTLPYIEKVYGVPQAQARAALGLPASGHDERSLRDWFEQVGMAPEAGRRTVEQLIVARQSLTEGGQAR